MFDGNDTDYQEFRSSFRIHMSFVSAVSHTLMDMCEAERNQILVVAVKALREAHVKCYKQMCYLLALITKASVRTHARSVEAFPNHHYCEIQLVLHSLVTDTGQSQRFCFSNYNLIKNQKPSR